MEFVFAVTGDKQGSLKKVLEEDAYAKDSFGTLGYTLKESSSVGLKGGKYIVFFKTDDAALAAKLKERLAKVEGIEELTGADKDAVVSAINAEADTAASGFGSIFG
jgi:hypothetical protein